MPGDDDLRLRIGQARLETEITLPQGFDGFQFRLGISALRQDPKSLWCGEPLRKREQLTKRCQGTSADHVDRFSGNGFDPCAVNRCSLLHAEKDGGSTEEIGAKLAGFDQRHRLRAKSRNDQAGKARTAAKVEPSLCLGRCEPDQLSRVEDMAGPNPIDRSARDEILSLVLFPKESDEPVELPQCFTWNTERRPRFLLCHQAARRRA